MGGTRPEEVPWRKDPCPRRLCPFQNRPSRPLRGRRRVGSQANLSGGSSVNNFDALYVMTVGPPKDLTTRESLGVIAINRTASAPGAPLIAAGKWIAAVGSVQQAPSYTFSVKTTPSLGT